MPVIRGAKRHNGVYPGRAARRVGELVGVHVIPRPVDDLEKVFPMLRPKA